MHILRIDHVNIAGQPELVAACRDFYVDVLGLHEGYRPSFESRGAWLYAGNDAIVHLTETTEAPATRAGAFNHFALRCVGLEEMLERLRLREVAYVVEQVGQSGGVQVFIKDPAGVGLELTFSVHDSAE